MPDQQRENELDIGVAMRSDTAQCKFDKFPLHDYSHDYFVLEKYLPTWNLCST